MPTDTEYIAGWIDSSIHDFLGEIDSIPAGMRYTLITCLDSCFDLPLLLKKSSALGALRRDGTTLGRGFLVRTSRLLTAERKQRVFFGFDEVFFFPQRPSKRKPESIILTGPARIGQPLPTKVKTWMSQSRCNLALGDGTGLNFIARLSGIAKHLLAHRLERVS